VLRVTVLMTKNGRRAVTIPLSSETGAARWPEVDALRPVKAKAPIHETEPREERKATRHDMNGFYRALIARSRLSGTSEADSAAISRRYALYLASALSLRAHCGRAARKGGLPTLKPKR
jgi:hypothetical protein